MAGNLIRWKKGDYIKLGKAVSEFNKKIKELQVNELDYLPDLRDYETLKQDIYTRSELNRIINSLKRINKAGATNLYTTEGGQRLTKWEASEIKKAQRRALGNIKAEIVQIELGRKSIGMGDERLRELEATKKSIENIENKKGEQFNRVLERIGRLGRKDIQIKKANTFKNNFLEALERCSNYENYDKLIKKLNTIKNPQKFYEYIKQSDVFMDLFVWYDDESGTLVYGSFKSNEDAFNRGLEELGIDLNE